MFTTSKKLVTLIERLRALQDAEGTEENGRQLEKIKEEYEDVTQEPGFTQAHRVLFQKEVNTLMTNRIKQKSKQLQEEMLSKPVPEGLAIPAHIHRYIQLWRTYTDFMIDDSVSPARTAIIRQVVLEEHAKLAQNRSELTQDLMRYIIQQIHALNSRVVEHLQNRGYPVEIPTFDETS